MIDIILVGSFVLIFYTYFGYPAILWLMAKSRPAPRLDPSYTPRVTVAIAAFDEEGCIGESIQSILDSHYPRDLLDIVVVSDASSDRTDEIVSGFPPERVQLLRQERRSGQTPGLLKGAQAAHGDIVILADASGHFLPETVQRLASHFVNPRIGAVSGYSAIGETESAVSQSDGVYARYDRLLRSLESRLGSSWVGCQGGLFAIRRGLFQANFPLDIAADNATCYALYERGYLHRYDPAAMMLERPPRALMDEFQRKIRIIVLQLRGMLVFRRLFNPRKHAMFFFQNVSHKVCRWLVPFALIGLWVTSGISGMSWARSLFILQCLFYTLAAIGVILEKKGYTLPRIVSIPAYFVTVNLAGLLAWTQWFRNYTVWTPPKRQAA